VTLLPLAGSLDLVRVEAVKRLEDKAGFSVYQPAECRECWLPKPQTREVPRVEIKDGAREATDCGPGKIGTLCVFTMPRELAKRRGFVE
jgi:hypothetical protein